MRDKVTLLTICLGLAVVNFLFIISLNIRLHDYKTKCVEWQRVAKVLVTNIPKAQVDDIPAC